MVGDLLCWFPRIFTFVMLRYIISTNTMFAPLVCAIRNQNIETASTMQYWLFIVIFCMVLKYHKLCWCAHKAMHSCFIAGSLIQNHHLSWWRHQREPFPRYWPFVRGIQWSPVNSPDKGQWRGALVFFIYAWKNSWVNYREAADLRRHRAHYDDQCSDAGIYRLRVRHANTYVYIGKEHEVALYHGQNLL